MNSRFPSFWSRVALVATSAFAGWSGATLAAADAPAEAASGGPPWAGSMEADLARTLKEQSSFYVFKSASDWAKDTANLKWDDSSDLPEYADVNAKKGGTLAIQISDFPGTFRTVGPHTNDHFRQYLLDSMAMQFGRIHPNFPGRFCPELADRWAEDRPNRTVYIELDPKSRWSDGTPFTTEDVVFTWYFYRSPHLNEPWYNDFYTKTYERLTVYDAHRFAITQPELKPDLLSRSLEHSMYQKKFFAGFGPGWESPYNWRIAPTTGAFTFTDADVKKGRSITMSRDKGWWAKDKRFLRGRYNPDRLRFTVIRDPDKALEGFIAGEVDIIGLANPKFWYEKLPDDHPAVAAGYIAKTKFFNQIPRADLGLWINRSKPVLDNRDVREGLHYATDITAICAQYYRGDAVQMNTRSDGYGWRTHPTITARKFDPVKARELFAKAGFTKQGPDGILLDEQGRRLSFTITSYNKRMADPLTIIKQSAIKAGVDFKIEILDETTGWKKMQEKQHDIAVAGLNRSVEMYPRFWEMYHGYNAYEDAYVDAQGNFVPKFAQGKPNPKPTKIHTSTNNMTLTFLPELDRRIEAYDRADSMDQIKDLAGQIEQIIYDDAAWVNGWTMPFYRVGYWRWIKWPEKFNGMQSRDHEELWLMWIDQDAEKETRAAQKAGKTFPPQINSFEAYKR